MGSAHHPGTPYLPLEYIVANVNFDMIGRNAPGEIALVHPVASKLASAALAVAARHPELGLTLIDQPDDGKVMWSDSRPFVQRGIENRYFHAGPHEDYHTPADEVDKLDVEKVVRVATLGYWIVRELGEEP